MKFPKEFELAGKKQKAMVAPPASAAMPTAAIPQSPPSVPPQPTTPVTTEEVSKLDTSWLPFAAKTYQISPDLDDYIVVNMMICPSEIPNRNGVGFQTAELVKFLPPPMNRQVFKAWAGCPVHLEHDNEDHLKAVGVIFDTSFRRIQNYGDGKHWAVYGLIGIDKTKYPDLAQKLLTGAINTGSMGCLADSFTCSVCGAKVHENKMMNCSHVGSSKEVNWRYVDHGGQKKIAFLFAHDLSPIEFSVVETPAWVTCLSDEILTPKEDK